MNHCIKHKSVCAYDNLAKTEAWSFKYLDAQAVFVFVETVSIFIWNFIWKDGDQDQFVAGPFLV